MAKPSAIIAFTGFAGSPSTDVALDRAGRLSRSPIDFLPSIAIALVVPFALFR